MTRAEREAAGRAARKQAPRGGLGGFSEPEDRPDPISILEEQGLTRVGELLPLRYGRMAETPFAFFRGSAAIMARDLARRPDSGLLVQASGDAHLANFGVFAAPDRRMVFDLNDFDETHPAPFEWDVQRLAASLVVAARGNGHREPDARAAAREAAATYRRTLARAAEMRHVDVWYTRIETEAVLDALRMEGAKLKNTERALAKADRRTQLGALDRFAERIGGTYRIRDEPPLIAHLPKIEHEQTDARLRAGFDAYLAALPPDRSLLLSRYRFTDFARKVVGVGSVGLEAYMVLLMGDRPDDPLFLQVKEAHASVLAGRVPTEYESHGRRVVVGQQLMQAASDPFLGWLPPGGGRDREYYVRQLRDKKGAAPIDELSPASLSRYGRLCATALGRAHARTGDPAAIAAYLGKSERFEQALESFAAGYADQNERDHAELLAAIAGGRLPAQAEASR